MLVGDGISPEAMQQRVLDALLRPCWPISMPPVPVKAKNWRRYCWTACSRSKPSLPASGRTCRKCWPRGAKSSAAVCARRLGSVDEDRIKQEFALFAQKIDIDEELERLSTHVSEVRRVVERGGIVGKRLDFLMQELNREANTTGSKSVSPATTQASVELKVLIEQMREQIQNLE